MKTIRGLFARLTVDRRLRHAIDREHGRIHGRETTTGAPARTFQEAVLEDRRRRARPDIIVAQSLDAGYAYKAERDWTGPWAPIVVSTAPHEAYVGRIVLVITDPTTLDPDMLRQLRAHRDRLDCVVRP